MLVDPFAEIRLIAQLKVACELAKLGVFLDLGAVRLGIVLPDDQVVDGTAFDHAHEGAQNFEVPSSGVLVALNLL